jgi:hypothetical protein
LPAQRVRPWIANSARGVDSFSLGYTVEENAGGVRKGPTPQVMAVLWNSIIELCTFSGKSGLAAANRHDMCHPKTLVEFPSIPIGERNGPGRPGEVLALLRIGR